MNLSDRFANKNHAKTRLLLSCRGINGEWLPVMPLIFIICFAFSSFLKFSVLPSLTILSSPFQEFCLVHLPPTPHTPYYAALVCGSPLPHSDLRDFLRLSGLIHLAVVSGTHLVCLDWVLKKLRISKRSTRMAVLFVYLLGSGAQPPVVRSWIGMGVLGFSRDHHFQWRPVDCVWISGGLTLLLIPEWVVSYSLILSWGAALALSWAQEELKTPHRISSLSRLILTASCVYFFMYSLLLPLGVPHPISIAFNVILAPLISFFAFPLTLLCFFIPPLTVGADAFWNIFENGARAVTPHLPLPGSAEGLAPWTWYWMYLFAFHFWIEGMRMTHRRTTS